jgi:hypothetical protein
MSIALDMHVSYGSQYLSKLTLNQVLEALHYEHDVFHNDFDKVSNRI